MYSRIGEAGERLRMFDRKCMNESFADSSFHNPCLLCFMIWSHENLKRQFFFIKSVSVELQKRSVDLHAERSKSAKDEFNFGDCDSQKSNH